MTDNRTLHPALGPVVRLLLAGVAAAGALVFAPSVAPAADGATAARVTTSAQTSPRLVRAHRLRRERNALAIARRHLGDRYAYGATGPHAFDCSGLTFFAYHRAGFHHLPRTSSEQGHFVRHIKRSHLRRGDLVFFTGSSGVYHVGIYSGWHHHHRTVIHAPYPGAHVRRERIWTNSWFAGTLR